MCVTNLWILNSQLNVYTREPWWWFEVEMMRKTIPCTDTFIDKDDVIVFGRSVKRDTLNKGNVVRNIIEQIFDKKTTK